MFARTLLIGAFAALAAAQSTVLSFTRVPNPVTDGEAQAITYATNDTASPVTIILRQGASNNLQTVETLTTDATGGQFVWTPRASLPNGNDYALEIRQAGQVNYFGPFSVQGAIPASVSAYASSTSANATTASPTGGMNGTTTGGNGTMPTATGGSNSTMNSTMTATTGTAKKTGTAGMTATTGRNGMTTTMMTNTPAGSPTGASGPSTTGGAMSEYAAHSSFALVFGALAAIFYLG